MEPINYGKYYHIYNRGNNHEDLFRTADNYRHFLRLYEKYISPVAETFAWVLMKNHFHLLVRITEESEIGYYKPLNPDVPDDSVRFQTITMPNQSGSAATDLSGSAGPDRVTLTSEEYFNRLIIYIHTNPEHHGFTNDFKNYPWPGYGTILPAKPTKLERDIVPGWFGDKANFEAVHKQKAEMIGEYWAIE